MTDKNITTFMNTIKQWIEENKTDGHLMKWIRKTYKTHSWKSTLMVVNKLVI